MAASNIKDGHHICGYCCEMLENMNDPKELACGHVHCGNCMRMKYADVGGVGDVHCPHVGCGKWYAKLDIDSLKQVAVNDAADKLTCDRSKCKGKSAASYCVDCGEKLCATHVQSHNGHYEDEHFVITIEVYRKSPRHYEKVFCDVHTNELVTKGCKHCSKLVCVDCDRNDSCFPSVNDGAIPSSNHEYQRLDELVGEITCQLKKKLRASTTKITELEKLDKEAWRQLDVIQEQCQQYMQEIDELLQEQVSRITRRCKRVKEKVRQHEQEMMDRVELFSAELVAKREEIQSTHDRVNNLLMDGHRVDVVLHRQSMDEQLTACIDEELNARVLADKPALVRCGDSLARLDLVKFPLSLKLDSTFYTKSSCYSSCIRGNGDVMLGCGNGLKAIDNTAEAMASLEAPSGRVYSVVEHRNVRYILHVVDDVCMVQRCLPNLGMGSQQSETLFEFPNSHKGFAPVMSVSDHYVVVFDCQDVHTDLADVDSDDLTYHLVIYDLTTGELEVINMETPQRPHFLADGHLLIVQSTQIEKVRIEKHKLVTVWTCDGLSDAFMACSDANGFIYVTGWSEVGLLYVISPQGKMLREIPDAMLPYSSGQLCVEGDMLYLPDIESCQLCCYELIR